MISPIEPWRRKHNYGWWNFDFDELFFHMLYKPVEPKVPKKGLRVKWFRDIGWAAIHTNMAEEENHLAFQFKSSPYGSVKHRRCNLRLSKDRALSPEKSEAGAVYKKQILYYY
jgi:hypothetical protein